MAQQSTTDLILLDDGYGTGETSDWSLISGMTRPFLLTKGLTSQDIPQTITRFAPYAVDISSGMEAEKQRDRGKILAAVAVVRGIGSESTGKPQNQPE